MKELQGSNRNNDMVVKHTEAIFENQKQNFADYRKNYYKKSKSFS